MRSPISELNTQEKIREKNQKFREFHTRGLENVQMEHNLVCTAHNLREMCGKLGSSVAALSNIKVWFMRFEKQPLYGGLMDIHKSLILPIQNSEEPGYIHIQ